MRRGIGRALLGHAVSTARGGGASTIAIDVDPNAEPFYLACGARREGVVAAPVSDNPARVRPQLTLSVVDGSIKIRTARAEDALRLHELHAASVCTLCAKHYTKEIIEGWLESRTPSGYLPPIEREAILVAEINQKIIGFGEAATGAVVAVYVDPSATGQGVGRLILARAVDLARDGHSGPIRVQSTLNATSFYEHHGFVEVKRATVSRNQVEVPIVVMERRAG
jgi:GNAT superfamily N-acetyltransferase